MRPRGAAAACVGLWVLVTVNVVADPGATEPRRCSLSHYRWLDPRALEAVKALRDHYVSDAQTPWSPARGPRHPGVTQAHLGPQGLNSDPRHPQHRKRLPAIRERAPPGGAGSRGRAALRKGCTAFPFRVLGELCGSAHNAHDHLGHTDGSRAGIPDLPRLRTQARGAASAHHCPAQEEEALSSRPWNCSFRPRRGPRLPWVRPAGRRRGGRAGPRSGCL